MREFKFRAWWKDTKRFLDGDEWYMTCSGAKHLHYSAYPYSDDDFIIEQYTGLKDKNDKEIYEGDVVGIYQEYVDEDGPKTWEELEPWGQVTYEDEKARFGVWGDSPYEGEDRYFFDLVGGIEVIGNIHENPELMEEGAR